MIFAQGDTILFQGDSITDAGRDKTDSLGWGRGYVALIGALLAARHPELNLTILNRGISGNRTQDLLDRWQKDCVELKPSIVSILIGINNVWRRYDRDAPTTAEAFKAEYREIIDRTLSAGVRELIVLEPFLLPIPDDRRSWREDLDPKIAVCRELAAEYRTRYVPLDGLFNAAATRVSPAYWTPDGVHPTPAGHGLIADAWMNQVVYASFGGCAVGGNSGMKRYSGSAS